MEERTNLAGAMVSDELDIVYGLRMIVVNVIMLVYREKDASSEDVHV